jgi:superfamily I DNA/RNA helicase
MKHRLQKLKIDTNVQTFNSFSEKIIQKYHGLIYSKPTQIMTYGNKVMAIMSALNRLNLTINDAIDLYFSSAQKRNKTFEELSNLFMNDCFFIVDYFKTKKKELYDFSIDAFEKAKAARMVYDVCNELKKQMELQGLRTYTDQVLDTINLFLKDRNLIPEYEHILVDEYQDVNETQIELLKLLNPKKLFCVGDPRQSIFGWRGSNMSFILNFNAHHENSEIISLIKNYRSKDKIVRFMNLALLDLGMPELKSDNTENGNISINDFNNEEQECQFIVNKILNSKSEMQEIFVLARTNRQLLELSKLLRQRSIRHIIKNDDSASGISLINGAVVLATIHSIKGLEAKEVFVMGCNEVNFPCKNSDHPVIEIVKVDEYDKEEEEKRVFYVAISRAKDSLYLTHTGKPTYFITEDMKSIVHD